MCDYVRYPRSPLAYARSFHFTREPTDSSVLAISTLFLILFNLNILSSRVRSVVKRDLKRQDPWD